MDHMSTKTIQTNTHVITLKFQKYMNKCTFVSETVYAFPFIITTDFEKEKQVPKMTCFSTKSI